MTYNRGLGSRQPLRSRDRRSRALPTFLIVAGIVMIVGAAALWRGGMSALLWRSLAPAVAARNALGSGSDAQLRAELASTTAQLSNYNELVRQNAELKAMLGRTPPNVDAVLAGVLERPPAALYDNVLIDVGSNDGIVVGDKVAAGGSTLIGTVTQVAADTSVVTLYSAAGSTYPALLRHASSTAATAVSVSGQGAGSFVAQVPAGTQVAVGDDVVFAGIAGNLVAQVSAVSAPAGSSFATIYMSMPVNIFDLDFVEVWRGQS